MMIVLTEDGRQLLERYLQQIRILLSGCRSVDPADVERDVMEHIERELHDAPEPVASAQLGPVLKRLGDPKQWIPTEELPWWRRLVLQLRTGPEDYRLAYLSFGLFILGFFVSVFWVASFSLSRAAMEVIDREDDLRGQRWLLYPSLIWIYLLLLIGILFWPFLAVALCTLVIPFRLFVIVAGVVTFAYGLWLVGVARLLRKWPSIPQILFYPFGDWFDPKWTKWLWFIGASICTIGVICVIGFLILFAMVR